jgi:CHASE3 domain sensor protein
MSLSSIKIGPKIALVAAVPIILFLIVCGVAISAISSIVSAGAVVDASVGRLVFAERAEITALVMQSSMRGFAATGDEGLLKPYLDSKAGVYDQFKALNGMTTVPAQLEKLKAAEASLKDWQAKTAEPIIAKMGSATFDQAATSALIKASGTAFADMRATLTDFIATEEADAGTATTANDATVSMAYWAVGIGGGLALVLGALMALFVGGSISRPLQGLTKAMADLAAGNTATDVQGDKRGDEIGGMARATLVFKENAIKVGQMTEAEAARIIRDQAERTKMMGELQAPSAKWWMPPSPAISPSASSANSPMPSSIAWPSVNALVETTDRGLPKPAKCCRRLPIPTSPAHRRPVSGRLRQAQVRHQCRGRQADRYRRPVARYLADAEDRDRRNPLGRQRSLRTHHQAGGDHRRDFGCHGAAGGVTVMDNAKKAEDASVKAQACRVPLKKAAR